MKYFHHNMQQSQHDTAVASDYFSSTATRNALQLNQQQTGSAGSGGEHQLSSVVDHQITMTLEQKDLWSKFHSMTNEMILTKAGRTRIFGLEDNALYTIQIEFRFSDDLKYRFVSGEWKTTPRTDLKSVQPPVIYIHPDSPNFGYHWKKDTITFSKLKLTNSPNKTSSEIVFLQSLHKYDPVIHILKHNGKNVDDKMLVQSILFKETQFIAVTAYQNEKITNLKIEYNPFAKAFKNNSSQSVLPQQQDLIQNRYSRSVYNNHHHHHQQHQQQQQYQQQQQQNFNINLPLANNNNPISSTASVSPASYFNSFNHHQPTSNVTGEQSAAGSSFYETLNYDLTNLHYSAAAAQSANQYFNQSAVHHNQFQPKFYSELAAANSYALSTNQYFSPYQHQSSYEIVGDALTEYADKSSCTKSKSNYQLNRDHNRSAPYSTSRPSSLAKRISSEQLPSLSPPVYNDQSNDSSLNSNVDASNYQSILNNVSGQHQTNQQSASSRTSSISSVLSSSASNEMAFQSLASHQLIATASKQQTTCSHSSSSSHNNESGYYSQSPTSIAFILDTANSSNNESTD